MPERKHVFWDIIVCHFITDLPPTLRPRSTWSIPFSYSDLSLHLFARCMVMWNWKSVDRLPVTHTDRGPRCESTWRQVVILNDDHDPGRIRPRRHPAATVAVMLWHMVMNWVCYCLRVMTIRINILLHTTWNVMIHSYTNRLNNCNAVVFKVDV
jgi:hypothetical protein